MSGSTRSLEREVLGPLGNNCNKERQVVTSSNSSISPLSKKAFERPGAGVRRVGVKRTQSWSLAEIQLFDDACTTKRAFSNSVDIEDSNENDDDDDSLLLVRPQEGISLPSASTVWYRGCPAVVEWEVYAYEENSTGCHEEFCSNVKIELRRWGSQATTVVQELAPNTGSIEYTQVPWGMPNDDGYYILITYLRRDSSNDRCAVAQRISSTFSIKTESSCTE